MTALAGFQSRVLLRGRAVVAAAAVFGVSAGVVAILGLGSFRQVGLGAVGPAAAALINLAILLPTAQAMLLAALAIAGDREGGLTAMLRAGGVRHRSIVASTWLGVVLGAWIAVTAGFGVAALVVAGNVPLEDLPVFGAIYLVALAVAAAAAAIGVLIGTLVATRLQAALVAVAAWFVLAIGLDLLVIGLGVFLRLGEVAILTAVAADPLTSGRLAALMLLDADSGALGPTGIYLLERLGRVGAVGALAAVCLAWTVIPLGIAARVLRGRDV
jgi:Cu-processing system permease protein